MCKDSWSYWRINQLIGCHGVIKCKKYILYVEFNLKKLTSGQVRYLAESGAREIRGRDSGIAELLLTPESVIDTIYLQHLYRKLLFSVFHLPR